MITLIVGKTGPTQPGLTSAEVAARRQQGLTNAVQIKTSRSLRDIVMGNVFNPPNLMLYVIGIGMIVAHDVGSSLGAAGLVLINTLVGIAQEVSVKRQLDKIALLTQIKVKVVRDHPLLPGVHELEATVQLLGFGEITARWRDRLV